MTKRSALVAAGMALLLAATLPAQSSDASSPSAGVSKVRIVRLSEVKGLVAMDRNNGRGLETAMANLPVVEKSRLQTGEGIAEVEFEDNSTLRLAPDSAVEFPQLERGVTGATISSVHLTKGMAYVSLVKGQGNEFNLLFADQTLALQPGSHIRLQMDGTEARLAVLDGSVRVDGQSGAMDVGRKKTITFDLLEHAQPAVAKDILPEPYDSWDQTATGYHSRVGNAFSGSPYAYGTNDMNYYGSFSGCGGMGMMWRPYFASAGWEPYSNGAYAWYQGAGYSWVSPYPWGWTPYHYGSWAFCPGMGWGWQPGGNWNGLNNIATTGVPQTGSGGQQLGHHPPAPPIHPPRSGEPTVLAVNTKPIVQSGVASGNSFQFRKDSAGLGVPRDGFGKLEKFSQHTIERGAVNEHVYLNAPAAAMNGGRPTSTAIMAGSIHRGSAPAPSMGGGSRGGSSMGASSGRVSTGSSASASSSASMSSSHASSGGGASAGSSGSSGSSGGSRSH